MKKKRIIILAGTAAALAVGAAVFFSARAMEMKKAPDPRLTAAEYLDARLAAEPGGEDGPLLVSYALDADCELSYRRAVVTGDMEYYDTEKLADGLCAALNERLAEYVDEAAYAADVYNADKTFREEYVRRAFDELLTERMAEGGCVSSGRLTATLAYDGQSWAVTGMTSPLDGQSTRQELYEAATEELVYVKKQYRVEEGATSGQTPDKSGFGSTDDPAVIEALLATDTARELMNGQETAWNSALDFIPGRLMRWYMDETILVLQWQEVTAKAVGTFSEVFIADGSQLRRKLAGDSFGSYDFEYPTELARQADAVLAVGGDLYNHSRACGIVVYDRVIYRFEPDSCDTCYICADGSMKYSLAGQFSSEEQAQAFIDENDVLFSLCFGPVMIADGQDVTPDRYAWGEIDDTYARSSLGMLGERHYLTMNINCEWTDYYYLATLQQATDAMLAHGCVTAYALDGGQTACTVLDGELINVVQFNTEKLTSDIVYFATALPAP